MIDTILYDLDGTLVDSNELILETFHRTLNHFLPNRTFSREDLLEMMGPPLQETFEAFAKDQTIIDQMIAFYRNTYVEIEFEHVKPYEGVLETIRYFRDLGFHQAIVTTKFYESAAPSIKTFGLDQSIEVVVSLDDVSRPKPHPEPIYKALSAFDHDEAVMVGDNATDLLAGRAAGIKTCGVAWSLKRAGLKQTNPDFCIHQFRDLIDVIDRYNKEEH
ncbi:MAG: pyrophosphatase PpaX [Candidatus Izemoplasmatales bacterium]